MSMEPLRETIASRLRAQQPEINEAIYQELRTSVPDTVGDDAEYESGLYRAVAEAVDHCIKVIEWEGEVPVSLPAAILGQARRAARQGVDIETIVHRVALGGRMVQAFATAEADDLPARELNRILGSLGPAVDQLILGVEEAHKQERERLHRTPDGRRIEVIERLLAGGRPDPADEAILRYRLHGWHLAATGIGLGVQGSLRDLAEALDSRLLFFDCDAEPVFCWLGGGERRLDISDVQRQPAINRNADIVVAIGEPGEGIDGWRRSHEQARLVLLPGSQRAGRLTRATDVLPEAILSKDRAAARLLVDTYISPLDSLRGNGGQAREVLRSYYAHDRCISATANALDIARGTVEKQLRDIEKAIGRPLCHEHQTRLELALRLEGELARWDG